MLLLSTALTKKIKYLCEVELIFPSLEKKNNYLCSWHWIHEWEDTKCTVLSYNTYYGLFNQLKNNFSVIITLNSKDQKKSRCKHKVEFHPQRLHNKGK